MSVAHETLPLSIGELQRTRAPLERATMLPRAAFTDPRVLEWEIEHLFRGGWICAGHVDQVRERGEYLMVEVGGESVIVVADDDGLPRAFLNTCRHRGARLVDEPEGRLPRLQCPYHAWTYGFDGSLRNAPFTDGLEDFDPAVLRAARRAPRRRRGPRPARPLRQAPSPDEHVGDLAPAAGALPARRAAPRAADRLRGRRQLEGDRRELQRVPALPGRAPRAQPALRTTSRARRSSGAGAWCGGSMTLAEGVETMAATGGQHAAPPIAGLTEDDQRSILYFLLFPNTLVSLHPDYVMLHTLWPRAPDRTEVVCEWFFEPATMAGRRTSTRPTRSTSGTRSTARTGTCASSRRRGMASRGFEPGRYTSEEIDVHAFDVMVADRYMEALAGAVEVGS